MQNDEPKSEQPAQTSDNLRDVDSTRLLAEIADRLDAEAGRLYGQLSSGVLNERTQPESESHMRLFVRLAHALRTPAILGVEEQTTKGQTP